jgi:hypothetical protein
MKIMLENWQPRFRCPLTGHSRVTFLGGFSRRLTKM